ncbi:MAG: CAP domain-containing protein [Chloroflexia bacterium]|nr:CAP domain-containing protein [Chloroflexia bacterium]
MNKPAGFLLLFVLTLLLVTCKKNDDGPSNYDDLLVEEVNNYRTSIGLAPLESHEELWKHARDHSVYMAENQTNTNSDGLLERYEAIRTYFGGGTVVENVARGTGGSAEDVVKEWLASIGHKANIEGNYTMTGISAVKSDNGSWYFTQIFFKQ